MNKQRIIPVRFTPENLQLLDAVANLMSESRSALIRRASLAYAAVVMQEVTREMKNENQD